MFSELEDLIEDLSIENHEEEIMHVEEGEFTVTGSDSVEIVLKKEPEDVCIEFIDDKILIPCDPHHHHHHRDYLDWYVKHYHRNPQFGNNYVLKIEWKVHGVRKIKWVVKY